VVVGEPALFEEVGSHAVVAAAMAVSGVGDGGYTVAW
jgi:hypothetical protein